MVCLGRPYHFIFLKAVFHKFYLVHSWIHLSIYLSENSEKFDNYVLRSSRYYGSSHFPVFLNWFSWELHLKPRLGGLHLKLRHALFSEAKCFKLLRVIFIKSSAISRLLATHVLMYSLIICSNITLNKEVSKPFYIMSDL